MRIGLIVPGGVDRSGTVRVIPVLLNLIERLARRNSVCVFALHQSAEYERYELLGATVVNIGEARRLPWGSRGVARAAMLLRNIVREKPRFDVLHAIFAGEPGAMATLAGRVLGIPVITTAFGGEFVEIPQIGFGGRVSRVSSRMVDFALRNSTVVTVPSRHQYELCPRKDAVWLPIGIDTQQFTPALVRKAGPPWSLLTIGTVNRVKDHATLLRAVQVLIGRGIDVRLRIIGEDILNGAVHRQAAELGLQNRVEWLGFRRNDELPKFYAEADVYVHSSLHEGMSVVALEAAASGTPLVGTHVGIFQELAPDCAVSVPIRNPEALADAIQHVLEQPNQRVARAKKALEFARAYDADWTAAAFESLYRQASSAHEQGSVTIGSSAGA